MINRRSFIAGSTALAGATFLPRNLLGGPDQTPPSEQLNVAVIGTGGQGITNIRNLLKHLVGNKELAPSSLPQIIVPPVPTMRSFKMQTPIVP